MNVFFDYAMGQSKNTVFFFILFYLYIYIYINDHFLSEPNCSMCTYMQKIKKETVLWSCWMFIPFSIMRAQNREHDPLYENFKI